MGEERVFSLKNRLFILSQQICPRLLIFFVQDLLFYFNYVIDIFEKAAIKSWLLLKCILVYCMLQIQSIPSYKSDFYELMLILSIKIWHYLQFYFLYFLNFVFIFFKTDRNLCIALQIFHNAFDINMKEIQVINMISIKRNTLCGSINTG